MPINRNNYEGFFLLYIDKELSVQEKNAVDDFLQSNPDLYQEFLMLQQSVLPLDKVVFKHKNALLVNEPFEDEIENRLLMLLDNQLNELDTKATKQLIETDLSVKKEWDILQKTKLAKNEEIVFEEKHLLYKKETGRVIAFPWLKMAVAALFIGGGLWGGIKYYNAANQSKAFENSSTAIKKINQPAQVVSAVPKQLQKENSGVNENIIADQISIAGNKKIEGKAIHDNRNSTIQQPLSANIETAIKEIKDKQTASNNLPKPLFENNYTDNSNKNEVANVTVQQNLQQEIQSKIAEVNNERNLNNSTSGNNYISNASFVETNKSPGTFDEDEDGSKSRKTKLGGFLKKAKRILERNSKIKSGSGNNLQVANLSFAIQ